MAVWADDEDLSRAAERFIHSLRIIAECPRQGAISRQLERRSGLKESMRPVFGL